MKREAEPEKVDSGWDTDYDPKDKYYLSADDDPFDLYSPERKKPTRDERSSDRRSPSKGRVPDRGTSPPRAPPHAHAHPHARSRHHHHHHHNRSHSPSRPREDREGPAGQHKDSSRAKPSSSSHAGHSRPKTSRAGSSYLGTSRPRISRAGSSHAGTGAGTRSSRRPRPVRGLSHGSSGQAKHKFPRDLSKILDPETLHRFVEDFPWEEAGKVALQAGTVAAIKVGSDSVPWPVKGTKIASAALGAAVVDHVLKPKKKGGIKYAAMRHMAEVAMGNMVVGPALGKASSGGGGRSSGGKR